MARRLKSILTTQIPLPSIRHTILPVVALALAAALACTVSALLAGLWIDLRFHRAVDSWLRAHRMAAWATQGAIVSMQCPLWFVGIVSGATIARWRTRRWLRECLVYGFFFTMLLLAFMAGYFHMAGWPPLWLCLLDVSSLSVLLACAFLMARYRPASLVEAEVDVRCRNCGYNLFGLTKPCCPECGTPFDPKLLAGLQPGTGKDDTIDRRNAQG